MSGVPARGGAAAAGWSLTNRPPLTNPPPRTSRPPPSNCPPTARRSPAGRPGRQGTLGAGLEGPAGEAAQVPGQHGPGVGRVDDLVDLHDPGAAERVGGI